MRHAFTLLTLLALFAAFLVDPPAVTANGNSGPAPARNAKAEKTADKETQRIIKQFDKELRAILGDAVRRLKDVEKAAKKGKGIASVSGVPDTAGEKVSQEQARALFEVLLDVFSEYLGGAIEAAEGSAERYAASSPITSPTVATSTASLIGGGGRPEALAQAWTVGIEKGDAKLMKLVRKIQTALSALGYDITFANCGTPKLSPPLPSTTAGAIAPAPWIAYVAADCDGRTGGVVGTPSDTDFGQTGVVVRLDDTGSPAISVADLDSTSFVTAVWTQVSNSFSGGFSLSLSTADFAIRTQGPGGADVRKAETEAFVPTPIARVSLPPARGTTDGGGGGPPSDFPVTATLVSYRIDGALQNIPNLRSVTLTYDGDGLAELDAQFEHAFIDVTLFRLVVTWPTAPDRIPPKGVVEIPTDDSGADPRAVVSVATREEPDIEFTSANGGSLQGETVELVADRDFAEFFAGKPDIVVRGTVTVEAGDGATREIEFTLKIAGDDVDRVN